MDLFDAFHDDIRDAGLDGLRAGLIGRAVQVDGGFGPRRLLYADHVASGRALAQVEDFIRDRVLPYYANSHTEASWCGAFMTRLRESARARILGLVGGDETCHAFFTGAGATAGLNLLVSQLRIAERVRAGGRVVVLTGPYEHHSNILPWRESGATVEDIPEAAGGGPDLDALAARLRAARGAELVVGAFSACSNVTGIITDPVPVTRVLHAHGALAVWDQACGGPYLPLDMAPAADCALDAVVLSPHKFPGGPGASGLLLARDTVLGNPRPQRPGGGTVSFVSPWGHDYSSRVEAREEGGTPNVLGDIRAALVLTVKAAIGAGRIMRHERALRARALAAWAGVPGLDLLGADTQAAALPIFSFRLRDAGGGVIHHQLATRILSDIHGIQARGGCACAGPYAHRLLGIDRDGSAALRARLHAGAELDKPGWVRLNLSYLHDEDEVARLLAAVADLPRRAAELAPLYQGDPATARFALRHTG